MSWKIFFSVPETFEFNLIFVTVGVHWVADDFLTESKELIIEGFFVVRRYRYVMSSIGTTTFFYIIFVEDGSRF